MNQYNFNIYRDLYQISDTVQTFVNQRISELQSVFSKLDGIREHNQLKVLYAMQQEKLSAVDFHGTTGYGYGDQGRDKTEKIFARVFEAEEGLVRPSIASGTHALAVTLQSLLLPGDELLSITGKPYDTLQKVIGISGDYPGSLKEHGISYHHVELLENSNINVKQVLTVIKPNTKVALIQRSTGYTSREALTVAEIGSAIRTIKKEFPELIILVDNCYGEFCEKIEPTNMQADVMVGSLIKNPGGGIAISGGYIVGKKKLIDRSANRLTAPGLGKEVGLTFGTTRTTLQGLFFAPHVVIEAMKGAILFGKIFKYLGFSIVPDDARPRSDIIQAIQFQRSDYVVEFCRGIQEAAAVDSFAVPYPWDMPGYSDPVIMASGSFIDGSSIEISADAPLREPYFVYYQGGLCFEQCKLAAMMILKRMLARKLITEKNFG